jgi:hypothetical protein
MDQYLRIYQLELIDRFLVDRLHLPLFLMWLLFVFLYFGVLLILHSAIGTPGPANLKDVFRNPSGSFYYPNLIAATYDFIGNPLYLTLLLFLRRHVPHQFRQLQENGFIVAKSPTSPMTKFFHFLGSNDRAQKLAMIVYPIAATIIGTLGAAFAFLPQTTPGRYALWLTALSIYGRAAVLVQLIYIFVILGNYQFDFRLHLDHPDGCSGLAPFGELSIAAYSYLFITAMILAFGTLAGGTPAEIILRSTSISGAFVYLWLLFPLAVMIIFVQLIYRPHRALRELQRQHLLIGSAAWTDYHQQLLSNVLGAAKKSTAPLADRGRYHFSDDLELLEVWAKLNKYVQDMHTWPIPRRAFRIIAILVNPLIPILLPLVGELVRGWLP